MIFIYLILIVALIGFIAVDNLGRRKSIKVKKKRKLNLDTTSIRFFKKIFANISWLDNFINSFVYKLGIISTRTREENYSIIVLYMLVSLLISIVATVLLSFVFSLWYILLAYLIIILLALMHVANLWLLFKRKKVQSQFPEAYQIFVDYYFNCKNIKATINNTYQNMPGDIKKLFQKLARNLSSSYNFNDHILEFAKSLDNTWGYAFSSILIMSYENVGDVSEQLVFLSNAIAEDHTDSADEISELGTNKVLFGLIIAFTIAFFIVTLIANPIASDLYFNTIFGNNLILLWFIVIGLGMFILSLIDYL